MCVDEHGCWAWTGVKNAAGYGTLMVEDDSIPSGGKPMLAHRLSYLIFVGQIAKGQVVRHLCHKPYCVNPAHLATGTAAENMADKMRAGRWRGGNVKGMRNGNAKITPHQVAEIRAAYNGRQHKSVRSGSTLKELGEQYGVGISQIHRIVKGESWQ